MTTPLIYTKPRVTRCGKTGVWVVNDLGNRHRCGPNIDSHDEAFLRLESALEIANGIGATRRAKALARVTPHPENEDE